MQSADIVSTIQALFPQKKRYYDRMRSSRLRVSYESTEEKSSSRREETRAIRRTGNGTQRESATRLAKHSGNWLLIDGTEKALTAKCENGGGWEARVRSQVPDDSEVTDQL